MNETNDKVTIREGRLAGRRFWNVWHGRKIVERCTTAEAAERFVARRWYKVPIDDRIRAAKSDGLRWDEQVRQRALKERGISVLPREVYAREMDWRVAEIESL